MAHIPYMPFYVNDFEGDTAHLTLEEDGAYNRLLRLCWRTSGCSLPNDPEWIMRKLRVNKEQYLSIIKPVISEYFKVKKGRILQERLQKEFNKILSLQIAKKASGKKGGLAKSLNNKKKTSSESNVLLVAKSYQTPSNQNHNHNYTKEEKKYTKEIENKFDEFWKIYPKRLGGNPKKIALNKFIIACRKENPDRIIAGAKKYADQEKDTTDRKFIAQAVTWLNQERWNDDYLPSQKSELSENLSDWQDENGNLL